MDGVALAAIQGLNAKLETLTAQVQQKDREIDALRARVSVLESSSRDLRQIKDILAEMALSRSVLNTATSRLRERQLAMSSDAKRVVAFAKQCPGS